MSRSFVVVPKRLIEGLLGFHVPGIGIDSFEEDPAYPQFVKMNLNGDFLPEGQVVISYIDAPRVRFPVIVAVDAAS